MLLRGYQRQHFRHSDTEVRHSWIWLGDRRLYLTGDLVSNKVFTFHLLRELMLMEQFKRSVSQDIEAHFNNLEVKDLKAAIMEEQFVTVCGLL